MIKQVDWFAPLVGRIKCNSDGSARGAPGYAAAGGIFRDFTGSVKGCFSSFLGNFPALHAEFIVAMMAIEISFHKGWNSVWLECDSKVVVGAFSSNSGVPWQLLNRWKNCQFLKDRMNFRVSHIFRESNCSVDKLANFGVTSQVSSWWNYVPSFVRGDFF